MHLSSRDVIICIHNASIEIEMKKKMMRTDLADLAGHSDKKICFS